MIKITVNNTEIFYQRHLGDAPVILLHGWGGSHISMQGAYNFLSAQGCDVLNLDLPGFGLSPSPPDSYTLEDYAECIKEIAVRLELKDVTLIGHSFGGRISILLANEPWVKKIILTAAAGIKPKFSLKKHIKVKRYKRAKKRGADTSNFGSKDYKALCPVMQKIFVRIVNRHLDEDIKNIKTPTLLVWGKHDTETPLYMAKKILRSVSESGLVVFEGGHYVYAEKHSEFCSVLKSFLDS